MLRPPQFGSSRCPRCGETATNVQGVAACPACEWVDGEPKRDQGRGRLRAPTS